MSRTKTDSQAPERFSGEWETKRLGEITEIRKGTSITEKNVVPGTTPVIAGGQKPAYFHNIANRTGKTITVSASGAYAGYVALHNQPIFASDCSTISENPSFSIDYLYYYLVFKQNIIYNAQAGGAQPHVHATDLMPLQVHLPPLREQRAISEVLSDVDALLTALEALIAKKRDIKKATMQQLLTGKTRLPGFTRPWETKRLGDLGRCLRGVSYNPETDLSSYDKDSTVRLLRSNNIQNAVVILADFQYVEARKVSELQIMQADDILVCMANGSRELVGKTGLFRVKDGYTYTFGAFMGCFRVEPSIAEPCFVFYLCQTQEFRNFINLALAGSSINNLKPSAVESAELQIPDREEQRAIADVLSDMDAEIAALEKRLEKTRDIKQAMMQELLTGQVRLPKSEPTLSEIERQSTKMEKK